MNCYSDNPKQSLKCAKEVQQFSECVDLTRLVSSTRQLHGNMNS